MTVEDISERCMKLPEPVEEIPCVSATCSRSAKLSYTASVRGMQSALYRCGHHPFGGNSWSEERDFRCERCGETRTRHIAVLTARDSCAVEMDECLLLICPSRLAEATFQVH